MLPAQASTMYVTMEEQVGILIWDIQVYQQTTEQQRNKAHDQSTVSVLTSSKYCLHVMQI
jgi:hypothetical protein